MWDIPQAAVYASPNMRTNFFDRFREFQSIHTLVLWGFPSGRYNQEMQKIISKLPKLTNLFADFGMEPYVWRSFIERQIIFEALVLPNDPNCISMLNHCGKMTRVSFRHSSDRLDNLVKFTSLQFFEMCVDLSSLDELDDFCSTTIKKLPDLTGIFLEPKYFPLDVKTLQNLLVGKVRFVILLSEEGSTACSSDVMGFKKLKLPVKGCAPLRLHWEFLSQIGDFPFKAIKLLNKLNTEASHFLHVPGLFMQCYVDERSQQ